MVTQKSIPTPPYVTAAPPADALQSPHAAPTRPRWQRLLAMAVTGQALGRRQVREPHRVATSSARRMTMMTMSNAHAEAALAQRITGLGSGSYSGTPFPRARGAVAAAGATRDDAPSEAARHDHGIIDPSRHVSSVGRR